MALLFVRSWDMLISRKPVPNCLMGITRATQIRISISTGLVSSWCLLSTTKVKLRKLIRMRR